MKFSSRFGELAVRKLVSIALATVLLLAASPRIARAQSASAPEMKVVTPKDVHALIAANKGKVVFLNFFATYCAPCHKEFPDIIKLQDKPPFPVYIASSIDDDFYKGVDARWAAQGEALPMTMIFDRSGKEVHFYQKALTLEDMEHDVAPLLSQSASD
jgi:thiol-disulfide isomerase/thioredoxin